MGVEHVLVIILAAGLAVLLVLSIVLVVIIIGVVRSIAGIAKRAEETTENLNDVLKSASKRIAPAAISAVVVAALQRWGKRTKDKS